jgi:hypothetical protein
VPVPGRGWRRSACDNGREYRISHDRYHPGTYGLTWAWVEQPDTVHHLGAVPGDFGQAESAMLKHRRKLKKYFRLPHEVSKK